MSQSRVSEDDKPDGLKKAHDDLSTMMNQGRSFSGRERNCVFLNTGRDERGEGRFACISGVSGLDFPDDGRAISVSDWDGDGDQDLWIANRNGPRVRLLRNDTPSSNHYLDLILVGNGVTTNRDAIGARVEVWPANSDDASGSDNTKQTTPIISTVRSGEGFLSQSSKIVHIGLGDATAISKIVVRWPGGEAQELTGLQIDSRYRLAQDQQPELVQPTTPAKPLLASAATKTPAADRYRVPLVPLLKFPNAPVLDTDGNTKSIGAGQGGPLLINCWSTTCKPCLKELEEFAHREESIRAAGLRILAVSVDNLGSQTLDASESEKILDDKSFPFERGYITEQTARIFNLIHNAVTAAAHELPVPTSFLIDAEGRLSVIYKGPVTVDQILADLDHSSLSRMERFAASAPESGASVDHEVTRELVDQAIWLIRLSFAHDLSVYGMNADAIVQYEDLLREKFNLPSTHAHTAVLYAQQKDADSAIHHFQKAISLGNTSPKTFHALAKLLVSKGQPQEAIGVYEKLLSFTPNDANAHLMIAAIHDKYKRYDDAQQHYEKTIALQADAVIARSNLAVILSRKKQWADAETHLTYIVEKRPDDALSLYNLGVVLAKQNRWQQAIPLLQKAVELKPDFKKASGLLRRSQQQLDAASKGNTPNPTDGTSLSPASPGFLIETQSTDVGLSEHHRSLNHGQRAG